MGHIADTIASMALCRPRVQFRLIHNQRVVKDWAPATDPLDRAIDVLGASVKKELQPVTRAGDAAKVSGVGSRAAPEPVHRPGNLSFRQRSLGQGPGSFSTPCLPAIPDV